MRNLLYLLFLLLSTLPLYAQTVTWDGGGEDGQWTTATNWDNDQVPGVNDDVIINTNVSVTLSSGNHTVESVTLGSPSVGSELTIAAGDTLNTTGGAPAGSDGFHIEGNISDESKLTINGTLNINNPSGDGLDFGEFTSGIIGEMGSLSISNTGNDGIEISDNLSNAGTIIITNHSKAGLYAKNGDPNRTITNTGTMTISGGEHGIDQQNNFFFTNTGTVTLSNASIALIDDGTNLTNNGIFKGDSFVENGDGNDVVFNSGSTVAPGTSVGTLTFDKALDISGVSLEIEIDSANSFDKVIVNTGDLTLTGATLNLSGSYIPVGGEEFMLLEKVSTGAITDNFSGLPEGATLGLNDATLAISYVGGDGNDVTLTYIDGPLPIELIVFTAHPMQNDIMLGWQTATETNNDFFTIEHSTNGKTYSKVALIGGAGTTLQPQYYSHLHQEPVNGTNYYRLRLDDFNGSFAYSDVVSVDMRMDWEDLNIYPNPFRQELTISLSDVSGEENLVTISNSSGQLLLKRKLTEADFETLDLSDLEKGYYFLRVSNKFNSTTKKILKIE